MKTAGIRNTNEILTPSNFRQSVVLSSGVGQAFDVPTGAGIVAFAFDQPFWVQYGSTGAIVPSSSSTAGSTNSEYSPTVRNLSSTLACTGISLVSDYAAKGSLSWFAP